MPVDFPFVESVEIVFDFQTYFVCTWHLSQNLDALHGICDKRYLPLFGETTHIPLPVILIVRNSGQSLTLFRIKKSPLSVDNGTH